MLREKLLNAVANQTYDLHHHLTDDDVEKVAKIIEMIESRDKEEPQAGDGLMCNNYFLENWKVGHLQDTPDNISFLNLCINPKPVFVDRNGLYTATGEYWLTLKDLEELHNTGKVPKLFWTWGHDGECEDGGILFVAYVNCWLYLSPKIT